MGSIKPTLQAHTFASRTSPSTDQSLQELENLYGSLSQKAFRGELTIKEKV